VRPLPDVGRADPNQAAPFLLESANQLDRRRRLLWEAERVADVFDAAGDADPATQVSSEF
jgi:hypothetical protein